MTASTMGAAGPYDRLYQGTGQLWGDSPGRMVRRAARVLPPGRCLDLGCGDGRNLLFLEQAGWTVDAVDLSSAALDAAHRRLGSHGMAPKGSFVQSDAATFRVQPGHYDLVLAYGLYHCLDDARLDVAHRRAQRALRAGGLFAFAALDNRLPVPHGHTTGALQLRSSAMWLSLFANWLPITIEVGFIDEDHEPVLGRHQHAATWGLFVKS